MKCSLVVRRMTGQTIPSMVLLLLCLTAGLFLFHGHTKSSINHRDLLTKSQNGTTTRKALSLAAMDAGAAPDTSSTHSIITASIHQGYGTHFINLHCGTPPQRQTLIIDTGSDVTGFVCHGCHKCGRQHNFFVPELSSSFQELTCQGCLHGKCTKNLRNAPGHCHMEASYREGSGWQAKEAADVCHVGDWDSDRLQTKLGLSSSDHDNVTSILGDSLPSQNRFPLKFACQTSVSGAFRSQLEDGIVGLEYSSASLWRQMYNSGAIQQRAFSLCFGRSLEPATDGTAVAGVLTMGGVDRRLHSSPMVFAQGTEKSSKSEYFYVTVRKVYLREGGGGNSARSTDPKLKVHRINISEDDLNDEYVIIDSGATDTYFTKKLEAPFQQVWKKLMGERFDRREEPKMTKEELDSLPTMLFQLRGVDEYNRKHAKHGNTTFVTGLAGSLDPEHPFDVLVAVPPAYYYEYNQHTDRYYSRFHFDPAYDSAFGSSTMLGHDILFDIENRRIGWAESACDYSALVASSVAPDPTSRDVRAVADTKALPKHSKAEEREEDKPVPQTSTKQEKSSHNADTGLEDGKISMIATKGMRLALQRPDPVLQKKAIEGVILFCASTKCRMLMSVLLLLSVGRLLWWASNKSVGRRKRRQRASNFHQALKAALSDDEDERDEQEPKRRGNQLKTRSFDSADEPEAASGGGSIFRLHNITRRYRA